jgi:hypothetical protein
MSMENGEGFAKRRFIICTIYLIVRLIKCKRLRWGRHVARMREGGSTFIILTGKLTAKTPLERLGNRWEDNIIIVDLREISGNARNWIYSAPERDYLSAFLNKAFHQVS